VLAQKRTKEICRNCAHSKLIGVNSEQKREYCCIISEEIVLGSDPCHFNPSLFSRKSRKKKKPKPRKKNNKKKNNNKQQKPPSKLILRKPPANRIHNRRRQ